MVEISITKLNHQKQWCLVSDKMADFEAAGHKN